MNERHNYKLIINTIDHPTMSEEKAPNKALMPRLPQKILASIILQLIPHPTPLALPPSHLTTKILLALTRTSRATHNDAIRVLYTHCLYIDMPDRLHQLCLLSSTLLVKHLRTFPNFQLYAWDAIIFVIIEMKLNGMDCQQILRAQVMILKSVLEWDLVKIV